MWYQLKSYLKFLIRSRNQHGIHSPFVYELVTRCFYDKSTYAEYQIMDAHRKRLYEDDSFIEESDFGAGSRVFKTNRRKLSRIAKLAGINKKRQRLLFRLSRYLEATDILELGTSLGLGTIALALSNPKAKIVSVEGCGQTAKKAQTFLNEFAIENASIKIERFEAFFGKMPNRPFDLIYLDGNHSGEATIRYFEQLKNKLHNDSVVILDDIYYNSGMTEAWNRIRKDKKVRVSIDTFYWGLVFFRKEQKKQHFNIRL